LEEAGYVQIEKRFVENKPYTGVTLTVSRAKGANGLFSRTRSDRGLRSGEKDGRYGGSASRECHEDLSQRRQTKSGPSTGWTSISRRGSSSPSSAPPARGKRPCSTSSAASTRPTEGRMIYDGQELRSLGEKSLSAYRRDRISFVFQSYNLIPVLTVRGERRAAAPY